MLKLRTAVVALGLFAAMTAAFKASADCAGESISTTKQRYAQAQSLERAGNPRAALATYVAAQEYTCEPNPVELPAAERAAALALPLGQAAEQANNFEQAYRLYDEGAHFAASDRALLALLRSTPDDPSAYARARELMDYRASPAFQTNNKVRLGVTGAYAPSTRLLAELETMPAVGAERAFKAEAAAFDEQYLREYVELIQRRPDDETDIAALQRHGASVQAFQERWRRDPLKASRDALELAHAWSVATRDRTLAEKIAAKRRERLEQRVVTITRTFYRAPELLDAAIDYQMAMHIDDAAKSARAAAIRDQAAALGDEASTQKRYGLAAEYYAVAQLDAKAARAREARQQAAMTKMQPQIDAMRKQAEAAQQAFGDPKRIEELQAQARRMQQQIQAEQQANAKANAKRADELEQELGL